MDILSTWIMIKIMYVHVFHLRMRIPGQPKEHLAALGQRVLSVGEVENHG